MNGRLEPSQSSSFCGIKFALGPIPLQGATLRSRKRAEICPGCNMRSNYSRAGWFVVQNLPKFPAAPEAMIAQRKLRRTCRSTPRGQPHHTCERSGMRHAARDGHAAHAASGLRENRTVLDVTQETSATHSDAYRRVSVLFQGKRRCDVQSLKSLERCIDTTLFIDRTMAIGKAGLPARFGLPGNIRRKVEDLLCFCPHVCITSSSTLVSNFLLTCSSLSASRPNNYFVYPICLDLLIPAQFSQLPRHVHACCGFF